MLCKYLHYYDAFLKRIYISTLMVRILLVMIPAAIEFQIL